MEFLNLVRTRWVAAKLITQHPGRWKDKDPTKHPQRYRVVVTDGRAEVNMRTFKTLLRDGVVRLARWDDNWFTVMIVTTTTKEPG